MQKHRTISEVKIPVRYSETDMMGVVYHANYIIWMELARTQFIKDRGLVYATFAEAGYVTPVIDIEASYKRSVVYGEEVTVKVWVDFYNGLKTIYCYEMYKPDGTLACTGSSTILIVKKENFRPVSMRKIFPEWHALYEGLAAESVVD